GDENVVEADHGNIPRHAHAARLERGNQALGAHIVLGKRERGPAGIARPVAARRSEGIPDALLVGILRNGDGALDAHARVGCRGPRLALAQPWSEVPALVDGSAVADVRDLPMP